MGGYIYLFTFYRRVIEYKSVSGSVYCIYYKRARCDFWKCVWVFFCKCDKLNNQVLSFDDSFSQIRVLQSAKKKKIAESGEYSTRNCNLCPFRGGCVEGVCLDWSVENSNSRYEVVIEMLSFKGLGLSYFWKVIGIVEIMIFEICKWVWLVLWVLWFLVKGGF